MSQVADNNLIKSLIDSEDKEFFDLLIRKAEERNKSKMEREKAAVNTKKDEMFRDAVVGYCAVNSDGKELSAELVTDIANELVVLVKDWRDHPMAFKLWKNVQSQVDNRTKDKKSVSMIQDIADLFESFSELM